MLDKLKSRYVLISFFLLALFVFMGAGLYQLTIVQGQENLEKSENRKVRSIDLQGQRGRILDRNGLPLAYNQKSYDIQFYRDPSNKAKADYARYTQILIDTINIIESGGGKTIDTFSIDRDENLNFRFQWGDISPEAAEKREKSWRDDMFGKGNTVKRTPEEIYRYLRRIYEIPEELDFDQAVKILSIWQEVTRNASKAYVPITIAYNVPIETVAQLELKAIQLEGISTTEGSVRIYPQGSLAAHIIGYMGRIEDNLDDYVEKGYNRDDLIGKTGIEQSMEESLTGNTKERKGTQLVEVNSQAIVTRSLEKQSPKNGYDVILTIDLYLQKVAELALENNIKEIYQKEGDEIAANPDKYYKDPSETKREIKRAEFGAVVVMDIKTGDVLAMASYPSFDLNLFTGGISKEDLRALGGTDEPDETAKRTTPLYNKAIKSKGAPGSIFKMVTALAGLEEGVITRSEKISDQSPFTEYLTDDQKKSGATPFDAPKCWAYPHLGNHQNLDVEAALKVSCNYFFSKVAYDLKIERLNKWAGKLGLDSLTNIELDGEAQGQIGGQDVIFDKEKDISEQRISRPRLVFNRIKERLTYFCNRLDLEADEEAIDSCARKLVLLVDPNKREIGEQVRQIMSDDLSIPKAVNQRNMWFQVITNLLYQLYWTPVETARTGFGQSLMLVTPVAAARYISALVNGGHVYDAHVVRRVVDDEGKTMLETKPKVFEELNANPENIRLIQLGMQEAVSEEDGGTAGAAFRNYKYNKQIGGKTGTAQIGNQTTNIDIENTSWFAAYAPRDNPEIAIIVYIPYGYKGAWSSSAVQDIVTYYMDRKTNQAPDNIPDVNTPVF